MNDVSSKPKTVEIEAVQWDGTAEGATPIIDWILTSGPRSARYHGPEQPKIAIDTPDGTLFAYPGGWIVRNAQGEFYPSDVDPWAGLSPMSVGGERLTWREAYEHERDRSQHYQQLASVLSDLDRCQHGRHEGDACTLRDGCDGPSRGNPHAQTGQVIGYGLAGERMPIVMPPRDKRYNDPDAWYRRADG